MEGRVSPAMSFESTGALHLFRVRLNQMGELNDHDKLVFALTQVDVVISTLAVPQYLDQLKIIDAMKEIGTIKRFVPSEYGNEVDRVTALPPFQAILNNKKKVRMATEMANIPYTYVSGNSFAGYFIDYFLHPNENVQQISVYGTGNAKAVLNYERDVAMYTVKAATDRRACNRIMIIRPPKNIICQNDLISAWENKTARKFINKIHVSREQLLILSQTLPHPENIPVSIIHNIFIKGDQLGFNLREDDLEASSLFPDYEYTSIDCLLDIFVINPPKAKLSVFA
ncbi:hypothetical protein Syun_001787 [Stephania yunnanensis]|uniref:NmrA-like domain-containing protein n=1 Tax=Stephania yunnanensis TaxID=152371 RepID=A0AAP0LEB7_9MAGN